MEFLRLNNWRVHKYEELKKHSICYETNQTEIRLLFRLAHFVLLRAQLFDYKKWTQDTSPGLATVSNKDKTC
jgi:hypothetical protein